MKPIGPYVAVHELPIPPPALAAAESPIQTLRATDRLTGIPVLLHVLPHAQSLPELPFSPHLLPVVDSGVDGEQAYLVTELPLHASPARDAVLAARGALAALAALHDEGLAHGGVSAAQLWDLGTVVALAGAGLPWAGSATPQGDLNDLVVTLQELGALPEALRPLRDRPGSLKAREALALLGGGAAGAQDSPESPLEDPRPPHDGTPIVLGQPGAAADGGVEWDDTPIASSSEVTSGAAPAVPPAGTGHPETPQERRKRQNEERREQARADSQAAAVRKTARLKAQQEEEAREAARAHEQAAQGVPVPEPFQMGFAEESPRGSVAASGPGARQVERLPASLRRPSEGQASEGVSRLPAADPATGAGASRRNLPPIRIGWDEDDSWRIVRSAPAPRPGLPRWVWLLLAVAVLLGGAAIWAVSRPKMAPTAVVAAPCCTVAFALRGVAGVTAQLSVDSAPPAAELSAGEVLGKAPGKIRFPVEGRYRLRIIADGYKPDTLDVTVPRQTTVNIDLGN